MRLPFWRWKQRQADLEDEIAHDLAAEAEERIGSGIVREEAEQASRRDFGNVLLVKENVQEIWGWTSLQRLGQDVRYGWRTFSKNPLFTCMAVLSLALGIGANTAIYSVMDAIMVRALPVRNPGELVILNWRSKQDPAYPGAHAVISAAGAAILSSFFGSDQFSFNVTSEVLAGVRRSFQSFSAAADEATLSRIFAGVHFSTDLTAGRTLGSDIAAFVLANALTANGQ